MSSRFVAQLTCAAVTLALASVSNANDVGVSGQKLILFDRAGRHKAVYVSKLDPGIQKGAGGDPTLLDATFEWFYTDAPATVNGAFDMGPGLAWTTNSDTVAKFYTPSIIGEK